ncbi:glycosyltransferase family 8 protein [Coniophora puteana RWD-64-598 SS2]|uniref:Glycosyltransferase family 8 protein n=1 Tax=Coniophora puteana (strain RWD-64-598) TaxID=741705 RepID=A0A5M3MWR0_CONPW|nr:glycosyltransferase family 8 protein [Coniophora puteana RWD-64-598 SS2]EIW83578.1 glycosyltransferase family 8 protein [Coniophora puteana RWD-64-598 SS2]
MTINGAFMSVLTKAYYLPGAMVLAESLRAVGSKYPYVVLVSTDFPEEGIAALKNRGLTVGFIEVLQPTEGSRPKVAGDDLRFSDCWSKLRVYGMDEYDRVVLLDADMLVRRNMDELMEMDLPEGGIAASHPCVCNRRDPKFYPADWLPENCAYTPLSHPSALTEATEITEDCPRPHTLLNGGLIVFNPSKELFQEISHYLFTSPLVPTFTRTDSDLLGHFFEGKYKPLPWMYNALKTLRTMHPDMWRDEEVRNVHYLRADKPWLERVVKGKGGEYETLNQWWWDTYENLERDMKENDPEGLEYLLTTVAH